MYNFVYLGKTEDNLTSVSHHQHATWELIYVRTGCGKFFFEDAVAPFEPGDIIIVPPNLIHYEMSERGYGNYYLFFRSFYIPDDEGRAFCIRDIAGEPVAALLRLMHQVKEDDIDQHLTESLFECLHQYIRALLPNEQKHNVVEALRRAIEESYCDPLYSPELDTEYCDDHLRRLFKQCYGVTPLRYLIMLRTNKAKQLMHERRTTNASLKQIAYESGYSDYYYFSRQFKKETGFSPRAWSKLAAYPSVYEG